MFRLPVYRPWPVSAAAQRVPGTESDNALVDYRTRDLPSSSQSLTINQTIHQRADIDVRLKRHVIGLLGSGQHPLC